MSQRFATTTFACLTFAAAATLLAPAIASANGISVARFGGSHGNVTEANAASVYYNPGALAFMNETQVMIDVAWALRHVGYERPAGAIDESSFANDGTNELVLQANSGSNELDNFVYAPMIGIASDFGTDSFAAGFAFYVPFGGSSEWGRVDQVGDFAVSDYGVNRFWAIDGSIRTLAFTGAASYRLPFDLSVGFSGSLLLNSAHTVRARNLNGTDNPATEGLTEINVSSTDYNLGAGVLWQASEDFFVGLSWQGAPNMNGRMVLDGTLESTFPNSDLPSEPTFLTQQFPHVFRLGGRYHPVDGNYELRLFADYTTWSVFDQQCIIGQNDPDGNPMDNDAVYDACAVNEDGSRVDTSLTEPTANLLRRWQNAFGVRAGASYYHSAIELMFGMGYDGNAVPDETIEPALIDMPKISFDIGGRMQFGDHFAMTLNLTPIIYFTREVPGPSYTQFEGRSLQPSSEGTYSQFILVANTNFEFLF